MEKIITMFRNKSAKGTVYYSAKLDAKDEYLNLFMDQENNERLNFVKGGKRAGYLFKKENKKGNVYYTGKLENQKVVAFRNRSKNNKYMMINVYKSEEPEKPKPKETPKKENTNFDVLDDDLQF